MDIEIEIISDNLTELNGILASLLSKEEEKPRNKEDTSWVYVPTSDGRLKETLVSIDIANYIQKLQMTILKNKVTFKSLKTLIEENNAKR